jgi:hypothetical protein
MKTVWQLLSTILLYGLLYLGSIDVSTMLMHFRHWDVQVPIAIGISVNGVLIPLGIGFLIAMCVRREVLRSAWPLLVAPLVVFAMEEYVSDTLYAPYWKQVLSLLGMGAAQGFIATIGWHLYQRLRERHQPRSE